MSSIDLESSEEEVVAKKDEETAKARLEKLRAKWQKEIDEMKSRWTRKPPPKFCIDRYEIDVLANEIHEDWTGIGMGSWSHLYRTPSYADDYLCKKRGMIQLQLAKLASGRTKTKSIPIVLEFDHMKRSLAYEVRDLMREHLKSAGFRTIVHFNHDFSAAYFTVFEEELDGSIEVDVLATRVMEIDKDAHLESIEAGYPLLGECDEPARESSWLFSYFCHVCN